MQKDIFDDILDLKDDDDIASEKDDPAPLVPTPKDFEDNCSILDNAMILFLNTNLLLDYRLTTEYLNLRMLKFQIYLCLEKIGGSFTQLRSTTEALTRWCPRSVTRVPPSS